MISSQTAPLCVADPEMADLIEQEKARQFRGLEMIASENFTSTAVMECLGSALTNKYAEGEVGQRYYGGTEVVDRIETLAKQRALAAFKLNPEEWGVNVQPYSGSPANFAVYTALLRPHERIMGLDLPSGGHLTHGFYTAKKKVSATSIFFESLPYKITADGIIDYEGLERSAGDFRPQMIVIGGSAYPRDYDYARVRKLCDSLGALLFMDMAHSAGLIAAGCLKSPFELCDIVTTTTHKSLRGPRAGMIFYRKKKLNGEPTDFESRICQAVFPGLQGGPHMHQIAAIATQMREVATPEFEAYARQVQSNCRTLAQELVAAGHSLASAGTDNHLILWNLRPHNITGARVDKTLEAIGITVNKNAIAGDKSALNPGGVRIGTCALTSRGLKDDDMKVVAGFLMEGLQAALRIHAPVSAAPLAEFVAALKADAAVAALREKVEAFAITFPMPGFDTTSLKYKDGIPH